MQRNCTHLDNIRPVGAEMDAGSGGVVRLRACDTTDGPAVKTWAEEVTTAVATAVQLMSADQLELYGATFAKFSMGALSVWDGKVSASGQAVDFMSANFFRIKNGVAVERCATVDYVRLYQAFGLRLEGE